MTEFTFLTGFITAVVEVIKATFKAFGWLANDDQRGAVIRWLAGIVGALVALAFQFDMLHTTPTLAGMIASGVALGIASDILHIGIDAGKAKVEQLQAPVAASGKVTVETEGGASASASVSPPQGTSSPENGGAAFPPTPPGHPG